MRGDAFIINRYSYLAINFFLNAKNAYPDVHGATRVLFDESLI